MKFGGPAIVRWRSRFKVYWYGHASSRTLKSFFRGCNHRYVLAEGQPSNGFGSPKEADWWMRERILHVQSIRIEISKKKGTFCGMSKTDPFMKRWV